jgi:hypothetical protein
MTAARRNTMWTRAMTLRARLQIGRRGHATASPAKVIHRHQATEYHEDAPARLAEPLSTDCDTPTLNSTRHLPLSPYRPYQSISHSHGQLRPQGRRPYDPSHGKCIPYPTPGLIPKPPHDRPRAVGSLLDLRKLAILQLCRSGSFPALPLVLRLVFSQF